MVFLISILRIKVNDSLSEIWTDDELQAYLDMHRLHIVKEPLKTDLNYLVYYSTYGMLESDASLWDSIGSDALEVPNTDYIENFIDGIFTFTSAQEISYYLNGKSYNLHGAIAECLEQLAMDPNRAKAWGRGSITYSHYDLMEMANYHHNYCGMRSVNLIRTYR